MQYPAATISVPGCGGGGGGRRQVGQGQRGRPAGVAGGGAQRGRMCWGRRKPSGSLPVGHKATCSCSQRPCHGRIRGDQSSPPLAQVQSSTTRRPASMPNIVTSSSHLACKPLPRPERGRHAARRRACPHPPTHPQHILQRVLAAARVLGLVDAEDGAHCAGAAQAAAG